MSSYNSYGNNNYRNQTNGSYNVEVCKDVKYINPYNFISLPKECHKIDYSKYQGVLTGYIECVLTAKTPIMVPDTNHIETEKLQKDSSFEKFKFFNYQEKSSDGKYVLPVIPGSEIRGMLRSDYEIFTNSCMSTLDKDITFISRAMDIKSPGILRKDKEGKWHLYQAERFALHTCRKGKGTARRANGRDEAIYFIDDKNVLHDDGHTYKTGDLVQFDFISSSNYLSSLVFSIGKGNQEGILFIGELGGNKEVDKKGINKIHDSIFVDSNIEVRVDELEDSVSKLKEIYDIYNDSAFNQKIRKTEKVWYAGYDIDHADVLPVWYSEPKNGRVYLSLASIGKEAYHRTIQELVGSFMPCVDKQHMCNACNMFGFTSDVAASSSRLRVSDACYIGSDNPYCEEMIIKELASPHIANACFYALYAPNNQFELYPKNFYFNYDAVFSQGRKMSLIDSDDITIRGRKMYWHHDIKNSRTNEKTERNCAITPVKEGTQFKFKVYFNHINQENLDELIAVLGLKYDGLDLCHKVGKAKPLGFGSCSICVDGVYIRNITAEDGKVSYNLVRYDDYFSNDERLCDISLSKMFSMDTMPMREALRIYDFNYIKKYYSDAIVGYPIGEDGNKVASMYWFSLNKSLKLNNPYYLMVLPRIIDGKDNLGKSDYNTGHDLVLPKYVRKR